LELIFLVVTGSFKITLTDNASFLAGVGCLTGRENFWFFAATTPTVPAEIQANVTAHMKDLGFNAPIAVEGKSPFLLKRVTINPNSC
jgi:hypothetical protein